MNGEWFKQPPDPPDIDTDSDWYWYYDIREKAYWAVEVWPKRYLCHLDGWWWSTPIKKPPKIKLHVQKRGRGRPKKRVRDE